MKKIAVITAGGDAPGMNAALRAVVRSGITAGFEVTGIQRGYAGLLEGQFIHMSLRSVSGIVNKGGTILKTVRCAEIRTPSGMKKAARQLVRAGIEGLVVIGGDGTLAAGKALSAASGVMVVGIPASIDNDIAGTDETIGFDTALDTAVQAIDKIRDTASSHERVFIVQVMGREHGHLTLAVGLAAGAEFILVPEVRCPVPVLAAEIKKGRARGKTSMLIVFAEGVGKAHLLAARLEKFTGLEVRASTLGYIQRGGSPSGRSRILAARFGAHAVELLCRGTGSRMVAMQNGAITDIPIDRTGDKPFDRDLYDLARRLAT